MRYHLRLEHVHARAAEHASLAELCAQTAERAVGVLLERGDCVVLVCLLELEPLGVALGLAGHARGQRAARLHKQEFVLAKTLFEFGFNETDLQSFFAEPAFYAWQRMGNVSPTCRAGEVRCASRPSLSSPLPEGGPLREIQQNTQLCFI